MSRSLSKSIIGSWIQKVKHQLKTLRCHDTFRMELDACPRVAFMLHRHANSLVVSCSRSPAFGQFIHNPTVIAAHWKWTLGPFEQPRRPNLGHGSKFAMPRTFQQCQTATMKMCKCLHAQTDAQGWSVMRQPCNAIEQFRMCFRG